MKLLDRQGNVVADDNGQDKLLDKMYNTRVGRGITSILIKPAVSRVCGKVLDTKLSTIIVPKFCKANNVDLSQYEKQEFNSFNDFFTRKINKELRPIDMDRTMLRISAMNLMLHSITHPEIDYQDSVSKQNQIRDKYTICLANPPFKGTIDAESINDDLKAVTNTKKTELLFLALFLRMLKKGGQCACIVPDGVLFGSSKAHKSIRKELVENHQLRAVISMPSGVFKPYAGVSTAVLVFTKTGAGGTENVWFYDMKADGFSLDDKRSEISENDIPDIIERFHNLDKEASRQRTDQSFFVPKQEIADNDYDLSINKYKKVEYVPVEYPSTAQIMADLHELEMEITAGLAELEEML